MGNLPSGSRQTRPSGSRRAGTVGAAAPGSGSAKRLHLPPGARGVKAAIPSCRSIFGRAWAGAGAVARWREPALPARRSRPARPAQGRRERAGAALPQFRVSPGAGDIHPMGTPPAAHRREAGSGAGGFPGSGEEEEEEEVSEASPSAAPAACGAPALPRSRHGGACPGSAARGHPHNLGLGSPQGESDEGRGAAGGHPGAGLSVPGETRWERGSHHYQ